MRGLMSAHVHNAIELLVELYDSSISDTIQVPPTIVSWVVCELWTFTHTEKNVVMKDRCLIPGSIAGRQRKEYEKQ